MLRRVAVVHFRLLLFVLALLLSAEPAFAFVSVGVAGSGCAVSTIQAAIKKIIDAENIGDYADSNIVVAGGTYKEALEINGANTARGAEVHITGGYDFGCTGPEAGAITTIDASGKSRSALYMHDGAEVFLETLEITGANNTSGSAHGGGVDLDGGHLDTSHVDFFNNHASLGGGIYAHGGFTGSTLSLHDTTIQNNIATNGGGGIYFEGGGVLEMWNAFIRGNQSNFGGGIYVKGSFPGLEAFLHTSTIVQLNTANAAGGGIRVEGDATLFMKEPLILVDDNTANIENSGDGDGGGLQVIGSPARVEIGSPGYNGTPVIHANHARNGAGISVQQGGIVRLFSIDGGPTRVEGNDAFLHGGGVYADGAGSTVCASGYGINGNRSTSGGQAGGAIYANGATLALTQDATFNQCGDPAVGLGAVPCFSGFSCNTINDNQGSTAIELHGSGLGADRVELRRNVGSAVLADGGSGVALTNCLIVGNSEPGSALKAINSTMELDGCTIADNVFASQAGVIDAESARFVAFHSILWQPGMSSIQVGGSSTGVSFTDVISWETGTLQPYSISGVRAAIDPLFVNSVGGDYHLQPDSLALDYSVGGPATDLDGNSRGRAIFAPGNAFDIGAYEVQSVPRGSCPTPDGTFCDGFDN